MQSKEKGEGSSREHTQVIKIELSFFLFYLSIFIIVYYFNNGKEKAQRIMELNTICRLNKIY